VSDHRAQSTTFRIRRSTDGQFLARNAIDWTTDASLAWETDYPPDAGSQAVAAQSAADHAFFAEVVPA
jgi:hypothetical protein